MLQGWVEAAEELHALTRSCLRDGHVHQGQRDALEAVRRAVTDGARSEAEAIQRLERSPSGAQTHQACHEGAIRGQGRSTTSNARVLARSFSPLSSQRQWVSPGMGLLSRKVTVHCPRVFHQNGLSKAYGPWEQTWWMWANIRA